MGIPVLALIPRLSTLLAAAASKPRCAPVSAPILAAVDTYWPRLIPGRRSSRAAKSAWCEQFFFLALGSPGPIDAGLPLPTIGAGPPGGPGQRWEIGRAHV